MNWLEKIFSIRDSLGKDPDEVQKPFLDHVEDLRWMFVKMLIALMISMVLGLIFRFQIDDFLTAPLEQISERLDTEIKLHALGAPDSIFITFRLAFYFGLVLSFPFLLYFLAEFVIPGLTRTERKVLIPGVGVGFLLFLGGVAFSYYLILPQALQFFYKDQIRFGWDQVWSVSQYYGFVTQFSLAFGLAFELPLVVIILVRLGLLTHHMMSSTRAYAVVIILLLSAIITPTTDPITLSAMAGPLYLLYELCIWIAGMMERKREAAFEAEFLPPDPRVDSQDNTDHK